MIAPVAGKKYHRLEEDYGGKRCRTLNIAITTEKTSREDAAARGFDEACLVCKPDDTVTAD
jgi:hypothetical protein